MTDTASSTPMTKSCYLVEIELKRVQTYLFEVPRLSVMVGANALMGETLRGFWLGDRFDPDIPSLPALAKECGSCGPGGGSAEFEPVRKRDEDPLKARIDHMDADVWQDDVTAVAERTGVLVRDGGHFETLFPTRPAAEGFAERARELIQQRVPGILLETRIAELQHDGKVWRKSETAETRTDQLTGVSLLDLPQARVCEFSGEGPASEVCQVGDRTERLPLVSQSVAVRHEYGRAYDRGETHDVLGILRPRLLRDLDFPEASSRAFPADFAELSTHGYLAVIHVDGNRVGRRSSDYAQTATSDDYFDSWRVRERFYHTLRIGMRIAVTETLATVFKPTGGRTRSGKIPARLLMLGGDDLVLVCGAGFALRFVVELAQRVRDTTEDLPDGKGPITLGAGVAIVQDSFPFYRAYELADQLASSAKRLKASLPEAEGNVVDWLATSEAWYGDVEATRRSQYVIDDELVLSAKPYRILKSPDLPGKSLEALLEDADKLSRDRVARNQLHGLANSLRLGRHTACFAAEMLPDELASKLKNYGYLQGDDGPWRRLPPPASLPQQQDVATAEGRRRQPQNEGQRARFLTEVLDLFELYELNQLVERDKEPAADVAPSTGPSPSGTERGEERAVASGERGVGR